MMTAKETIKETIKENCRRLNLKGKSESIRDIRFILPTFPTSCRKIYSMMFFLFLFVLLANFLLLDHIVLDLNRETIYYLDVGI